MKNVLVWVAWVWPVRIGHGWLVGACAWRSAR